MPVGKIPWRLEPQPEGRYTVTSPALRDLVTDGKTVAEARHEVGDPTLEATTPASRASNHAQEALDRRVGEIVPVG